MPPGARENYDSVSRSSPQFNCTPSSLHLHLHHHLHPKHHRRLGTDTNSHLSPKSTHSQQKEIRVSRQTLPCDPSKSASPKNTTAHSTPLHSCLSRLFRPSQLPPLLKSSPSLVILDFFPRCLPASASRLEYPFSLHVLSTRQHHL
jgi:hypothetical protein